MPDPRDFTSQYNTQLTPEEMLQYNDWANQQSKIINRNVLNDQYDYDMQGWWKNNKNVDLKGGHLTDQYKKPNHPTFSDQSQYHGVDEHQGGIWEQMPDKSWSFVPGNTNLKMYRPKELQSYFEKVEQGNKLELPPMPGAKRAPDGAWYVQQNGQYHRVE